MDFFNALVRIAATASYLLYDCCVVVCKLSECRDAIGNRKRHGRIEVHAVALLILGLLEYRVGCGSFPILGEIRIKSAMGSVMSLFERGYAKGRA